MIGKISFLQMFPNRTALKIRLLMLGTAASIGLNAGQVSAGACDVLPEAEICEASTPWNRVSEFPWGPLTQKPAGEAVVFHLDGRGFGVVQRLQPPHFNTAVELADWWVAGWFMRKFPGEAIEQVSDREGWQTFETTVGSQSYAGRKTRFKYQGRVAVVRFSFVRTEIGELVTMSWLNEKMNLQAGEYLHRGLLKSISIQN